MLIRQSPAVFKGAELATLPPQAQRRRDNDKGTGGQGDRGTGRQGDKEAVRETYFLLFSSSPCPLVSLSPCPLVFLSLRLRCLRGKVFVSHLRYWLFELRCAMLPV